MEKIVVETTKKREIIDITDRINKVLSKDAVNMGVCHLFLRHSTAGLATAYMDPEAEFDILDALDTAIVHEIPREKYAHSHFKTRLPNHVIASYLGASLSIPFEGKKLLLGDLQSVALVELNGPENREILIYKEGGEKNEKKKT